MTSIPSSVSHGSFRLVPTPEERFLAWQFQGRLCPKLETWYVKYNYTLLCLNIMWNCHSVDFPVPYITRLNCNTIFEDSSIILDPENSSSLLLPKWNWLSNWLFVSEIESEYIHVVIWERERERGGYFLSMCKQATLSHKNPWPAHFWCLKITDG